MFPSLFLGPPLALLACVLTVFAPRAAAVACVAAAVASMLGVTLAWGIDAETGLRGLVIPVAFLAVPIFGAVEAFRQAGREHIEGTGAPINEGAG